MSIDSIKARVYGLGRKPRMRKSAASGIAAALINLLPAAVDSAGKLTALGSTYLLGAAMLAGSSMGWGAAKITSKGQRDIDTVKKGYDNERLKADIGYLSAKLKQEQADALQAAPKAARIFN